MNTLSGHNFLKDCFTIRKLIWQIFHLVPNQFFSIYFFCDAYQQKSIKSPERLLRGSSQRYILKSPEMKLPADMQIFHVMLRIKKIGDKVIYFSNLNHFLKITKHEAFIITEKSSDHEEADTKLAALAEAANIANSKTVMIRSAFGDIDIIVLFILHEFDGITIILIDNVVGKRKIVDMSTSLLYQQ